VDTKFIITLQIKFQGFKNARNPAKAKEDDVEFVITYVIHFEHTFFQLAIHLIVLLPQTVVQVVALVPIMFQLRLIFRR